MAALAEVRAAEAAHKEQAPSAILRDDAALHSMVTAATPRVAARRADGGRQRERLEKTLDELSRSSRDSVSRGRTLRGGFT